MLSKEWDNSEMLVARHGMGVTAWRTEGNNCRKGNGASQCLVGTGFQVGDDTQMS